MIELSGPLTLASNRWLYRMEESMTVQEFEEKIQSIRAKNGWRIVLDCSGIWEIRVYDKETDKLLARTGGSGIEPVPEILEMPFDKCPWV